jgi:hypothetical protein
MDPSCRKRNTSVTRIPAIVYLDEQNPRLLRVAAFELLGPGFGHAEHADKTATGRTDRLRIVFSPPVSTVSISLV